MARWFHPVDGSDDRRYVTRLFSVCEAKAFPSVFPCTVRVPRVDADTAGTADQLDREPRQQQRTAGCTKRPFPKAKRVSAANDVITSPFHKDAAITSPLSRASQNGTRKKKNTSAEVLCYPLPHPARDRKDLPHWPSDRTQENRSGHDSAQHCFRSGRMTVVPF